MDNTPSLSPMVDARSRKTLSVLLQRLASAGQSKVARGMGLSEATVSRMKDADFERIAMLLTALGLKPVPVGAKCLDADAYKTLKKWAVERLQSDDEEPTGLHWGE